MREYNHKPNDGFNHLPLETLTSLLLPVVHDLIKALDARDESLIKLKKKEVEIIFCAIDSKKAAAVKVVSPETEIPEQATIDKQIKVKNKELKALGKEIKSKSKKRSGVVISEEIVRVSDEVIELNELTNP
jgi:hypothetical protein